MSTASQNFYLPDGYESRAISATLEETPGTYWTDERLESSLLFQYEVYRIAYTIAAKKRGPVRLLDVGCGPPRKHGFFNSRSPDISVSLVDQPSVAPLASKYLASADFIAADLETVDLDLGVKFDVVICADVIEHLENPNPCAEFIRMHTACDGVALISTPERDRLYGRGMRKSGHPAHVREWAQKEFAMYLESRGLSVIRQRILYQKSAPRIRRFIDPFLDHFGAFNRSFSCQLATCTVKS